MRLILVTTLLATGALTGCTQSSTCVDYGDFDNPKSMAEAAELVVVGTQSATGEHVEHNGANLAVHEIVIEDVLKGHPGTRTIEVASPPGGCYESGVTIDGGILDIEGKAEFFLVNVDGTWLTVTPSEGVEPLTTGPYPWDPNVIVD